MDRYRQAVRIVHDATKMGQSEAFDQAEFLRQAGRLRMELDA
jgi:hypothetical protein